MKARFIVLMAVLFLALSINSYAIDKDAKFIDSLGLYGLSYKDGKIVGYGLIGETALATSSRNWAFVLGIGAGTESPDNAGDDDFLNGVAGIKYYFSELTSLSILGGYMAMDSNAHVSSGTVSIKQRFIEVDKGVSPFITASGSYRDHSSNSSNSGGEIVGTIGLGCEFLLTKDLSLVFEGSFVQGEGLTSSAPEMKSGAMAAFYVTGYWD